MVGDYFGFVSAVCIFSFFFHHPLEGGIRMSNQEPRIPCDDDDD